MKKLMTRCSLALAVASMVLLVSSSSLAKDKWTKGWVSDSKCGAKGVGTGHVDCGNKCLKDGEKVVFVDEYKHKVYNVDNPDALKDHMGHRVAVQGPIDEANGSIHVDQVNTLSEKNKKPAEAAAMSDMHQ